MQEKEIIWLDRGGDCCGDYGSGVRREDTFKKATIKAAIKISNDCDEKSFKIGLKAARKAAWERSNTRRIWYAAAGKVKRKGDVSSARRLSRAYKLPFREHQRTFREYEEKIRSGKTQINNLRKSVNVLMAPRSNKFILKIRMWYWNWDQ